MKPRLPRARRPSPAMVVAVVAVVLALGGTGYAASTLIVSPGPSAHSAASADRNERGPRGKRGRQGPAGPQGVQGTTGQTGPAGGVAEFAEFYALMPSDNSATVGAGTAVQFPQNGPTNGVITRASASTFTLPAIGTYRVSFLVSTNETGQLELALNGTGLAYTVYGRATGDSEISGEALVQTSATNSVVSVINPTGNTPALTITPNAGGTHAVAASLTIQRLS